MDLVLYHGKIYLQKEKFAEAVWIHDDLVAAVGSDVQILAMAPLGAQKMDVGGRVTVSYTHLENRKRTEKIGQTE